MEKLCPLKVHTWPRRQGGAARGEGGRFAQSPHCSQAAWAALSSQRGWTTFQATFPQCFQVGWGLRGSPALRVEGKRQNTPVGPYLGVHVIEEGGQQPGLQRPHSPRFTFGSSDSWSKCVFLSPMMRASASRTTASLREAMRTNVSSLMGSSVWGAPAIPLSPSYIHLPCWMPILQTPRSNIRWLDGKAIALQRLLS